jgi:hypothetical protein
MEENHVEIQIADRLAYMNVKSALIPQSNESVARTEFPAGVRPRMQSGTQKTHGRPPMAAVEIFAGYSMLQKRYDYSLYPFEPLSAGGGEVSISGNFNKWLAAEFALSGYYKNWSLPYIRGSCAIRDYSLMAGPRLNHGLLYARLLFGYEITKRHDYIVSTGNLSYEPHSGFASTFGAGIQKPLNGRFCLRAGIDYVVMLRHIYTGYSYPAEIWETQQSYRVSAGIVVKLGKR